VGRWTGADPTTPGTSSRVATSPRSATRRTGDHARQRQHPEDPVGGAAAEASARPSVSVGTTTIMFGSDPVRTVGAGRLPVREVADPHQHRHADLVDGERQRLLADLDVGHRHLRATPPARSAASGTTMSTRRPARRGHPHATRRPRRRSAATRVGPPSAGMAAHSSGSGTSSSRARGCARAGRPGGDFHDDRLHGRAGPPCRIGDEVDVPRADVAMNVSSGRLAASALASGVRTIA
jgi:hypothetical protein